MSAEAISYVFRHSPYSGVARNVHIAIADVVNDVYDNRFWMRRDALAAKANTSVRSLERILPQMVKDGYLEQLTPSGEAVKSNAPIEYRFLFVDQATPRQDVGRPTDKMAEPYRQDVGRPTDKMADRTQGRTQGELKLPAPDGASKNTRSKDHLFEAIAEVCGLDWRNLTRNERGRLNTARKQLAELDVAPDTVRDKARRYRKKWPDIDLTPTALVSNWSQIDVDPANTATTRNTCPKCLQSRDSDLHTPERCAIRQELMGIT